jgi:hypothetical protein
MTNVHYVTEKTRISSYQIYGRNVPTRRRDEAVLSEAVARVTRARKPAPRTKEWMRPDTKLLRNSFVWSYLFSLRFIFGRDPGPSRPKRKRTGGWTEDEI